MQAIKRIQELARFGSILGLERITRLLEKLGNPQDSLKIIHVAGTNGKGSICRYIYEALRAEGYRTGLYTSPYLEFFNERIELDGKCIPDGDLAEYSGRVLEKSEEMACEGYKTTEFEVITAIAFLYFKEKKADCVVLEVGLGGRLDATNVVKAPLISVIASISPDHTERLGKTIAEIAAEKAGIIKENSPVVVSSDRTDALRVFEEKAKALSAPLYESRELPLRVVSVTLEGCRFETEIFGGKYAVEIPMTGRHQIENALAALYALIVMRKSGRLGISDEAIYRGFSRARQPGRFEIMGKDPYVIIDGAHNPDGARVLRDTVLEFFRGKRILVVIGILSDKDVDLIDRMIEISEDFVATEPDSPRKLDAGKLAEIIRGKGGRCVVVKQPKEAAAYAKSKYGEYDLILFMGSIYMIGEIRGLVK